jgi:hypothetical protein
MGKPIMLPALLLIPLVAIYRVLLAYQTPGDVWGWLPGFCPLSAVAFGAGVFLPRRLALIVPLGALLLSDAFINAHYGVSLWSASMLGRYLTLALIAGLGIFMRADNASGGNNGQPRYRNILLGTTLGSLGFYVATNTFTWFGSADYAQTAAGWTQALTTGVPNYLPSLYFFRNSLVSDLLYSTILFLACCRMARKLPAPHRAAANGADSRQTGSLETNH